MSFAKCVVCNKVGKWERVKYDQPAYCPEHMSAEDKQKIEESKRKKEELSKMYRERENERVKKFLDEGGATVWICIS
jgi:hypothetical protein